MNKQELIKRFEEIGIHGLNMFGTVVKGIPTETAIDLIKQLDEPKKPVVPQFVADWYEKHKYALEFNIFDYVYRFEQQAENDFKDWFDDINTKAIQILVNMHQFGYEVEEEKKYFVKIKAVDQYLVSVKDEDFLGFLQSRLRSKFTRKELEEAGLGWVFDCPGIEIEEVDLCH